MVYGQLKERGERKVRNGRKCGIRIKLQGQ